MRDQPPVRRVPKRRSECRRRFLQAVHTRQRRGAFHIVRLRPAALKPAEEWLAYYEQFWNTQLDALERHFQGEKK